MNKTKVLSKLRKLFAIADDESASPGETLNAVEMAQSLMAKHNIAEAELNDLENEDGSPWSISQEQIQDPKASLSDWEMLLLSAIAGMCGLKVLVKRIILAPEDKRRRTRYIPSFYGHADDCAFGKAIYKGLHETAKSCATAAKKKAMEATAQEMNFEGFNMKIVFGSDGAETMYKEQVEKELPKNFRKSFLLGFAEMVAVRALSKAKNQNLTSTEHEKNALVVSGKQEWLDDKFKEAFPAAEEKNKYERPDIDPHAFKMGVDDGKKAHLGISLSNG